MKSAFHPMLAVALCTVTRSTARHPLRVSDIPCAMDGSNTTTPLHRDNVPSTAGICIPDHVAPHLRHTEHVMVTEEQGHMLLGYDILSIRPGDLVVIPKDIPRGRLARAYSA